MRRAWPIAAVMVTLAAAAGAGGLYLLGPGSQVSASTPTPGVDSAPATAVVGRRTLSTHLAIDGTLGHGATSGLAAGVAGTLTRVPAEGTVLRRGDSLFEVDGHRTAFLLYGARPAWRALGPGAAPGPDIRQLKENLQALGFDHRRGQPSPRWDAATTRAVKAWQHHLRVTADGSLPLGSIVFRTGPLRVDTHGVAVGSQVGPGAAIDSVTGAQAVVTAKLRADRRDLVKVGDAVSLELPDGTTATGHVRNVGAVAHAQDPGTGVPAAASSATVDLVIVPDKAPAYDLAPVTIQLTSETHPNVLAVPITALVALRGGGYAVEAINADGSRRYLAVRVGMSADGYVEITGTSITDGLTVVVAQ